MNEYKLFYKYMGAETAHIVLTNQTPRWSTPGTLNDPYDMQFDLRYDIDRNIVRRMVLEKLWEAYRGAPVMVGNVLGVLMQVIRAKVPDMSREQFEIELSDTVYVSKLRLRISSRQGDRNPECSPDEQHGCC